MVASSASRLQLTRGSSAAHCVILNFCFWEHRTVTFLNTYMAAPLAPRAQELNSALGWNGFLFWVPKSVTILGTCFGAYCAHNLFSNNNERGYNFWSPFWEPLLVTVLGTHFAHVFANFGSFGNVTAHISQPCRHDEETTRRGVPSRTTQREHIRRLGALLCSTWHAATH